MQASGVTVVHTTPGRKNVIAGQTGIFRTDGSTADSAALKPAAGILVNLGEVPKESYKGKAPDSRMGTAAIVRKAFAEAQAYKAKDASAKNAKHEALLPALEGKVPVYFAAHRKDDIATALRIAQEFKLKAVIALGTEAYRMARRAQEGRGAGDRSPDDAACGGEHGDAACLRRQRRGSRCRGSAGDALDRL